MNTITTNGTRNVPVMTKSGREAIIANNPAIQALIAEAELANAAAVTEYNGVTYNQAEIRAWMRSAISRGNAQGRAVMKEVLAKKDFTLLDEWVNINGEDSSKQCLLSLEEGEQWSHFYEFFSSIGHNLSRGYDGLWCDAKTEEVAE